MKTILISLRSTKLSAALILLTIAFCLIGVRPVFAATVGIDDSHIIYGSYFHPAETLYSAGVFGRFRQVFENLGHDVVPLSSFSQGDLSWVDIVVLAIPTAYPYSVEHPNLPYSESEMAAIQALASNRAVFLGDSFMIQGSPLFYELDYGNKLLLENIINFLADGGGALFVTEWGTDNYAPDFVNWNDLLEPLGVEYADEGTDYENHFINDFVTHQITEGVFNVLAGGYQNRITANDPSVDLTINSGADDILAVYEGHPSFTVFMTTNFSELEGVGGFFFLPGSPITLEVDCEPDGSVDYTETRVVNPDGGLGFDLVGFNCAEWAGSLFRMYYTLNPSVAKEHNVIYMTMDSINFQGDVIRGSAEPGTELEVRVFDPVQPFPEGPYRIVTTNSSGTWGAGFLGDYDIKGSSNGWVIFNDEDGDHTQIEWKALDYLQVDGTLHPSWSRSYVTDDVYHWPKAGLEFYNSAFNEIPPEPIEVKINVFDDEEPPPGLPGIQAEHTAFMYIEFDPPPTSYPLPPMGIHVNIPLLEPLPFESVVYLNRVDPDSGELVPALQWGVSCIDPEGCPKFSWGGDLTKWVPSLMPATCYMVHAIFPPLPCPPDMPQCGHWVRCKFVATFSTLVGVIPDETTISIDIKPGDGPNTINLKKKGVVPVAILGTPVIDLDVEIVDMVDPVTLNFHGASPKHDLTDPETFADHLEDVNGDGFMDLVIHFDTQDIEGLDKNSTDGCLQGSFKGGQSFEGYDSVQCK
jgi:hypothetical protein